MRGKDFRDEWGQDPSVRMMRRVFAGMETAQKELLERLSLSPLDRRLRRIRESARHLFERAWPEAQRKGLTRNEEDAAALYLHCFVRMLNREGIKISPDWFPSHQSMHEFLSEEFQ